MTEVPPFPRWLTLTFATCGAIGSLVGVVIGHLLTRSWQHKQWLLDNKKQEYRELLSNLFEDGSCLR
jgi:membrane protein YqaA with SNARE-associated domain